jgi:hypothetical protein
MSVPSAVDRRHSSAVVLAGGDGTGLQGLTELIWRRATQHSALSSAGRASWPTRWSAWVQCFALDHTVCVLARDHEQFYRPELGDKPTREMTMQEEQYVKL